MRLPPLGAEASLTDQRHIVRAAARRHPAKPSPAKPSNISAQVEGSGTVVVPLVMTSMTKVARYTGLSPVTSTVNSFGPTRVNPVCEPNVAGRKSADELGSTATFVMSSLVNTKSNVLYGSAQLEPVFELLKQNGIPGSPAVGGVSD